jgi:HK97 family phage prohead protease
MDIEKRGGIPAEIRADDTGVKVSGYAAVFNEAADIGGMFREIIAPGAFRNAIATDDVCFLINHDGLPLARTRSGTLTLSEDDHGLRIDTTLDSEDPDVRSIVGKMKRGDLDKMSFSFRATKQTWDESQEPPVRTIQEAELFDVSIVTNPAYDGTSIALRSLDEARKETKRKNFNAAALRLSAKTRLDFTTRKIASRSTTGETEKTG